MNTNVDFCEPTSAPDLAGIEYSLHVDPNAPASKPAPHIGEGDGVSESHSQTPQPSPLAGAIRDGQSREHFSCRCNTIHRATPAQDRCVECRMPLTLRYDGAGRLIDPNIHVQLIGDMIADELTRLRGIIDDSRPHLTLADVSRALRVIDEARGKIKLHDLGETPLVMPRDHGVAPTQISILKSQIPSPEGT